MLKLLLAAGLVTASLVVGRLGWSTPWLTAGAVSLIAQAVGIQPAYVIYLCITCYVLAVFSRTPDDATGNAIEPGQALANDPKIVVSKTNVQRVLSAAGNTPLALVLGFLIPIPIPGVELRGLAGLCFILIAARIGLRERDYTAQAKAGAYKCFLLQSATLAFVFKLHDFYEGPNQLLVLAMIAGQTVPSILWSKPRSAEPLTYEPIQLSWGIATLYMCINVPGLTGSAGGMFFLRRSIFRPLNLLLISTYIEGWNLQQLCFGYNRSKTPLAELLNRLAPGALTDQFVYVLVCVVCVSLVGVDLLNRKWFCRISPTAPDNRLVALVLCLTQGIAAAGVWWCTAFIAVGFLNIAFYRVLSPDNDDIRGFAFLAPMVL